MEKIYIPTTTLNFNNILATESISPKSFYEKRNFGYKRFEKIDLNNFDNVLIGYSKLPLFDIKDEENDNYPLVLEISKNIIKDIEVIGKIDNIEIYKISSTIYLNPNKVKFLFLDEENEKISLIKAEPSISTKLLPLYKNSIEIYKENDSFKLDKRYLIDTENELIDITKRIYLDRNINRIKGFYYCYILGDIYTKFNSQSKLKQKLYNNISKRQEAIGNNNYQNIIDINEEETGILQKFFYEKIYSFHDVNSQGQRLSSFINPKDEKSAELYKNIINSIIEFDEINNKEEFKNNKLELLKKIGDNFKETFGKKDKTVEYIRNLLRHIKNFESFDIDDTDKEKYLLKSISYFVLRGDDLEKLLDFLKENNLKTFKIAFGLWGALFGFSAIPKTISNILFKETTKDTIDIQEFLKDMYIKIHNFDIQEDIKIDFIQKKIIENKDIKKTTDNTIQQDKKDIPKCPKCGADMILREPRQGEKWEKGYGCSEYRKDKTGCDGWIDYEEYHNPSFLTKVINNGKKLVKNINGSNQLTKEEILDKTYKNIQENGEIALGIKKLKIKILVEYLNNEQIKVPNTKRKFSNKEIKILIQGDRRFEVIRRGSEYLQIKEN